MRESSVSFSFPVGSCKAKAFRFFRARAIDANPERVTSPSLTLRASHTRTNTTQKMAEDLEEASNELIVTDEDAVRYGVGETFVLVENDDAEAMLEKALEETKAEVDALETEKRELQNAMAELKKKLYEKFGNAINLEE